MPVTRRQLLRAKDNNEDERVAEFEKFFRADVGRAERPTKRAVPKKNIFEKIDKNEPSSVFARSIKCPIANRVLLIIILVLLRIFFMPRFMNVV